ncbi:lactonase family protein [Paenibacillus sp. J22TS3]|uniref:lactonase family protein n=1 Tax=Paenibacillus sp. J22TS3 TaxID=2807192 RepID=UPI001B205595|nr:lactonase family protein [Paenibacillus sp. J22TS3]GIP23507.1 6-phosphogluconolactonase [Paenibacillus sp. J22TS3]
MAIQANGNEILLYVGSYSSAEDGGIHLVALNKESGELRLVHSTDGIENPSFVVVNEEGTRLYAVGEIEEGQIAAYEIDQQDGRLRELNRETTGGHSPCYICHVPGEESQLYLVNYGSAEISSYHLDRNGAIKGLASRVKHVGRGHREDRQEAAHAHSVVVDRSGKFAYVSDLGLDQIVIYRIEDGKLVTHKEIKLPPGAGPRHFKIHQTGKWAYGINELNNTVTVYSLNEAGGDLEILQHISAVPEDFSGESTTAEVGISPCGKYLYGSNRGHDSIVRYRIDQETGQLSDPQWVSSGGEIPRHFLIVKGGHLIAAHQNSNNLVSFRLDSETGIPKKTGYELRLSKPVCVALANNPQV